MKVAIIGAGISGLSAAQILQKQQHEVCIYEKSDRPGGLIKCTIEEGNLYHRVGGHVFNSRHEDVLEFFWNFFDRPNEFSKTIRNAKILLQDKLVGYPIENFLYQLDEATVENIVNEILDLNKAGYKEPKDYNNFKEFLLGNFGSTLYTTYFEPYNKKIWQCNLEEVSIDWLEGKLPMPNYNEMLANSILRKGEDEMVHSSFYYPNNNGSQFVADRLAEGLNIKYNYTINSIELSEGKWLIDNKTYDTLVYTADVRRLNTIIKNLPAEVKESCTKIEGLQSNGTSNVLCEISAFEDNSWIYLPENNITAHRIILTGNFAQSNNRAGTKTCVVEFSGEIAPDEMNAEIAKLPGNLKPIAYNYEPNTYVIQDSNTRHNINELKDKLSSHNLFLHGRFAEWEYYNMDTAMKASLDKFNNY
ncbi:protoporphyrinogen/coproporphyrinogen oxidase [Formosa sp. PL04]|uniref:protoporphyrinogen/coproporphyrinogen oxidase n=1 Tax=Formosa sp. PL04 TaxID=3081755 RepID=UPI0029826B44|nr:FAD-dependent oxidoreductase [Formosa sp. PL04]MDW5287886.1 NAD(P)-binding protein [Formosa sp. PL04]